MKDLAFVKTVAGAVICGMGATIGLVLSPMEGPTAWLIGGGVIVVGVIVAAIPLPRRRAR